MTMWLFSKGKKAGHRTDVKVFLAGNHTATFSGIRNTPEGILKALEKDGHLWVPSGNTGKSIIVFKDQISAIEFEIKEVP